MDICEAMLRYRAKNRLTQKECAEKIGVTKTTWTIWETGRQRPTKANEMKLKLLFEEEKNE